MLGALLEQEMNCGPKERFILIACALALVGCNEREQINQKFEGYISRCMSYHYEYSTCRKFWKSNMDESEFKPLIAAPSSPDADGDRR
jgi:aerobic-type carbon monoxide dehydrogenase small subunit (CoxS/CutS family)